MALLSSLQLRQKMIDEDLVPKQLIPLLARVKESKVVVVELLKLISVVGSTSPGDGHLGEDVVIRGLFQAVRECIPSRVTIEFAVPEFIQENDVEGREVEQVEMVVEVPEEMASWCLEVRDFAPPPTKTRRKSVTMTEEQQPPPLEAPLTPEEEYVTTKQLLRIGTFLLWRAISSFCGSISLTASSSSASSASSASTASSLLMARGRGGQRSSSAAPELDNSTGAAGEGEGTGGVRKGSTMTLRPFDHSTSDDDMEILCLLARCENQQIRACALGALATAASNDVMGDHIAQSESQRATSHINL